MDNISKITSRLEFSSSQIDQIRHTFEISGNFTYQFEYFMKTMLETGGPSKGYYQSYQGQLHRRVTK